MVISGVYGEKERRQLQILRVDYRRMNSSDHQRCFSSAGRERRLRQPTWRHVLRHNRPLVRLLANWYDTSCPWEIRILHKTRSLSVYRMPFVLSSNADRTSWPPIHLLYMLSRRHYCLRRNAGTAHVKLGQSLHPPEGKGLKAKPSKCVLFRNPIDFLGHMVSADRIQPQPDKLAAIRDWPTPHYLRDVREFYGLACYYRKFVKDFARIAEPLSRLTKKNTHFTWTEETQKSFEDLKQDLLDVDTLGIPCILDTDASDVAVLAVLSEVIDGVEKPIAYFSRVLNGTQRNYCPTRRELPAIMTSLQHFRHYLLRNQVILGTDHHSLKWLRTL